MAAARNQTHYGYVRDVAASGTAVSPAKEESMSQIASFSARPTFVDCFA
ncbi:Hypothetical protein NCS54_00943600 [Fusarium falciforme]|nr:Hypothetical protein NCS54_00943600 [Fusarium falciforme]WAO91950.1 Hypothetical protein NCS54_00943600 [Fusarium falciforme]